MFNPIDSNLLVSVGGWIIGGLVVVIGMRTQIERMRLQIGNLATEIGRLREALVTMTSRIDGHDREISFLKGLDEARRALAGVVP